MKKSAHFSNISNISEIPSLVQLSNNSDAGKTIQSFDSSCEYSQKEKGHASFMKFSKNRNFSQLNSQDQSFYSQINDFKIEETLDDKHILQRKVEKRDIVFFSKCLKESFEKYFIQIIFTFLKSPNDLSFALVIQRLKFYPQKTPFKQIEKKQILFTTNQNISSNNQNHSKHKNFEKYEQTAQCKSKQKFRGISSKQIQTNNSQNYGERKQNKNLLTIEQLLKQMFYDNKHRHIIFTFDVLICHLTFLSIMLYYWSIATISSTQIISSNIFNNRNIKNCNIEQKCYQFSIFQVLSLYIQERSQSININQINILIVFFFLNYLKAQKCFQNKKYTEKIQKLEQNLTVKLKLYRRIKKMQNEFSYNSNQFVLESQLHKYQFQHKMINNIQKTTLYIQLLNTHNFVSTPFQKYYQMFQFQNSRKLYHLKKDYFCIWVLNIILKELQRKNAQSLSKSAYYIIAFMSMLKKFKQNSNFQGISLILPVLYNIKELLPKIWGHALSHKSQISEKLKHYSSLLHEKKYKVQEISANSNAIIDQQVIYEMSQRFKNFVKQDNKQFLVDLIKHQKFYDEFLSHIIYHRSKIERQYSDEIQKYQKQKQIGISFNIYLLDTYLSKSFKGLNSKAIWIKLTEKAIALNKSIKSAFYMDLVDYCFIGSSFKYKKLDI